MNSGIEKEQFLTLQELVIEARSKLADNGWAYIVGGAETETSLRRNRLALDSLALRPRVLNDVSEIDTAAELFGSPSRLPVFLCPVGGLESFNPDGAMAVAKGATAFGVPMMLSSVSEWSASDLVANHIDPRSLIVQLYAREDAAGVDQWVERSNELSLPAFCITVDSAIYGRRERDIVARYVKPWRAKGEGRSAHFQASLSWKDIERIRSKFKNQLVLKGISTREDAQLAIEHGVDMIYVSNHGGRQLDHSVGSASALVEVVDAVNGQAKVLVDGGFCRGTDIAKAIALGADGVGLGRLMCFALAAAGAVGVERMLELLEEEYRVALGLIGVRSGAQLNQSHIQNVEAIQHDTALLGAFPLLNEIVL